MHVRKSRAISTILATVIIVVIVIAAIAGIYLAYVIPSKTTSSTTTTSIPSVFTYETAETIAYLDPGVSYYSYDYNIMQNVYEPLLDYNGTTNQVIPWLASSYTNNSAGTEYYFTLRSGIKFADGEPLNSTAVYFALNRDLVMDGSSPVAHCIQASWLIQQMVDPSLSCFLSTTQTYGESYVNAWLAQDFVTITGPLTFTINVKIPNAAFANIFTQPLTDPIAPVYVMQHDLAMWNQSSNGYTLPYATLSGNLTTQIKEYLYDLSATCNVGATQYGCGATYLDNSVGGSLAGTGPYVVTSDDLTTNDIVLTANPNYWGGPYQYSGGAIISPKIKTIDFNYVASQATRELDLKAAAASGQAMAIDVESANIEDIANKTLWDQGQLVSDVPGVTLYGMYPQYSIDFSPFDTNVTNPSTHQLYTFQPFADKRIRLAFADAVNITAEWDTTDERWGLPAQNLIPPGLPPSGSYDSSITPAYSYNTTEAAQLLIQAMEDPLTQFTFVNGTAAPPGTFNNSFGCSELEFIIADRCSSPITQTITLVAATGDTGDIDVFNAIAQTIDNISTTYNLGLTVNVQTQPQGTIVDTGTAPGNPWYMFNLGWFDDYPWVTDFTLNMLTYPGSYAGAGWNLTSMTNLFNLSEQANRADNVTGVVQYSKQMAELANQNVMYLWQFYGTSFVAMTSNVQGFTWNSNLASAAFYGVGPQYYATLY